MAYNSNFVGTSESKIFVGCQRQTVKMILAILAFYVENPHVTVGPLTECQWCIAFKFPFVVGLNKLLKRQSCWQQFKTAWGSCQITVMLYANVCDNFVVCFMVHYFPQYIYRCIVVVMVPAAMFMLINKKKVATMFYWQLRAHIMNSF